MLAKNISNQNNTNPAEYVNHIFQFRINVPGTTVNFESDDTGLKMQASYPTKFSHQKNVTCLIPFFIKELTKK